MPATAAWLSGEVFTVTMLLILASSSASRLARPAGRHGLVGDHEPDPGAGEGGLGEGAKVDHPAQTVERLQRRQLRPGAHQPVRAVLQHQDVLAVGQFEQFVRGSRAASSPRTGWRGRAPRRRRGDAGRARALRLIAAARSAQRNPSARSSTAATLDVQQPGRAGDPDVAGAGDQEHVAAVRRSARAARGTSPPGSPR